jgi:hypothetical protein
MNGKSMNGKLLFLSLAQTAIRFQLTLQCYIPEAHQEKNTTAK